MKFISMYYIYNMIEFLENKDNHPESSGPDVRTTFPS